MHSLAHRGWARRAGLGEGGRDWDCRAWPLLLRPPPPPCPSWGRASCPPPTPVGWVAFAWVTTTLLATQLM